MISMLIKIIYVLNPYEYKYGLDITRETGISKGTVHVYLLQLENLGYVESKMDEPGEEIIYPRYKYKLTKEGLKCKNELENNPTSCMDKLFPEPN